jgi:chorismate synthase
MSSQFGNKLKIQLFGQSHSAGLGVVIDGLPAGERIDMEQVNAFLKRRAGGQNAYSTPRAEADEPRILSGLADGVSCGAPLCATFENKNTRGADYDNLRFIPRPSHADYTAFVKHGGYNDASGGGHFSARLTLPLCFAGAVCLQLLQRRGIKIDAHIYSVGGVRDDAYGDGGKDVAKNEPETGNFQESTVRGRKDADLQGSAGHNTEAEDNFPTLNKSAGQQMIAAILNAKEAGDSLGGVIECRVDGLPAGLGEPIFDNIESRLAYALFAIPAVKGVEFGAGFAAADMRGSDYNDSFYMDGGNVRTRTNNSGGILGGITNGMPVIFRAAFKPTPSIALPQRSVNLKTGEDTTLIIKGRHDPCVVPRALPCVISAAAVTVLDIMLGG